MPVRIECVDCKTRFVFDGAVGERATCPRCGWNAKYILLVLG